jgi:hypothetical protein
MEVITMKLENELGYVIERMKKLDVDKVNAYKKWLISTHNYTRLDVRFCNDVLRAVVPVSTICDWYDKYGCNDSHITTLARRACVACGFWN